MQELGWLPLGGAYLWDLRTVFSHNTNILGSILHTLFGYSDHPTVLQGIAYLAYLLTAGGFFWHETRKPMPAPPAAKVPATSGASAAS